MERQAVISSNIQSIGYDRSKKLLEIEFNGERVYQYEGVPEKIYNDLMQASSHGQFFHSKIKDKYPTIKIE